jgi:hypothetical protein
LYDWQLDSTYATSQIACTTDIKLFGTSLGWTVIAPFSGQEADPATTSGFGFGDVVVAPYFALPPIMSAGRPVFAHGIEFDVYTPTGEHNADKTVNPGNHYWSLAPFYKATWLFAPGWELSGRFNYIHNFEHTVNGISYRTGDGVWINFDVSYEIVQNFHLGINGYWLKQLEDDKNAAFPLAQESLYLGPGFCYKMDQRNVVNFNLYMPVFDKNAYSDGMQINLQYIHPL